MVEDEASAPVASWMRAALRGVATAFGVATLASSIRHRRVLGATDVSVVVWFVAFGAVAVIALVGAVLAWRFGTQK